MKYAQRSLRWSLRSLAAAIALSLVLIACDVASAFAFVSLAPPVNGLPAETTPVVAPKLVVLGDSLAYGYRATPGRGWIDDFRRRLNARYPQARVANLSVCGSTVGDLRRQLRGAPANADAVLIVAGGNDLMNFTHPLELARDERNLLARVRAKYPRAAVIVANVPDISWRSFPIGPGVRKPLPPPVRAAFALLTNVDNSIIERTARRSGAQILDLHALTRRGANGHAGVDTMTLDEFANRYISFDGLHPNDTGYAMLADYAWPQVATALRIGP